METIKLSDKGYARLMERYDGYNDWCVANNMRKRKFKDWLIG